MIFDISGLQFASLLLALNLTLPFITKLDWKVESSSCLNKNRTSICDSRLIDACFYGTTQLVDWWLIIFVLVFCCIHRRTAFWIRVTGRRISLLIGLGIASFYRKLTEDSFIHSAMIRGEPPRTYIHSSPMLMAEGWADPEQGVVIYAREPSKTFIRRITFYSNFSTHK